MTTLLDALQQRNVQVNASSVTWASNTTVTTAILPTGWRKWTEFNYKTLMSIYGDVLRIKWTGPRGPEPASSYDMEVFNEETLEDLLRRFIGPTVNHALGQGCRDLGFDTAHLGRGSRCPSGCYRPDWSLVSNSKRNETGHYFNLLPGDTKLHRKWYPELIESHSGRHEWAKPVSQVMTYMALHESRYGFIITDGNLTALRIRCQQINKGSASNRSRRAVPHQKIDSGNTDISMASLNLSEASEYVDDNPLDREYENPEYAVIPWNAHGKGLTIKLALWCLSMMAMGVNTYVGVDYHHLDSWSKAEKGYIHNTSSRRVRHLLKGAVVEEEIPHSEGHQGAGDVDCEAQDEGERDDDSPFYGQTQGIRSQGYYQDSQNPLEGEEEEEVGEQWETENRQTDSSTQENLSSTEQSHGDSDQTQQARASSSTAEGRPVFNVTNGLQKAGNRYHFESPATGKVVKSKKQDWDWNERYQGYYYYGNVNIYFTNRFPS